MITKIIGIDYGARFSGKTVISISDGESLIFHRPEVKQDADRFVLDFLADCRPNVVAIDAPLSLPKAFFGDGMDHMYRQCDRELGAMSPMFLGGLTARAIQLCKSHPHSTWIETYPSHHVRQLLGIKKKTKDSLIEAIGLMETICSVTFGRKPADWHELDASMCWYTARRFLQNECQVIGSKSEGLIYL